MTPSASLVSVYWLVLLATLLVSDALVEARRPTISEEDLDRANNDDEYGGSDDDDDDNDRSELDYRLGISNQTEAEPRIFGGRNALPGEFPFVVRLWIGTAKNGCTASIVDRQHVLTAAHCLFDSITNVMYRRVDILMFIGDYMVSDQDDKQTLFAVDEFFLHPEYRHGESFDHDIAIIRTLEKITYREGDSNGLGKIDKIDLPTRAEFQYHPRELMVAGWGLLGANRPPANILQVLETELVYCDESNIHPDLWLCIAGHPRSTCYGDSGGPLFYKKADGRSVQLGITSFSPGEGCGWGIRYLVNVHTYVNWIDPIISTPYWRRNSTVGAGNETLDR